MTANVTTWTAMSTSLPSGTLTLVSKVTESVGSALEHLKAMSKDRDTEPVYDVTSGGWRWTWEYIADNGVRCTDTVRIY